MISINSQGEGGDKCHHDYGVSWVATGSISILGSTGYSYPKSLANAFLWPPGGGDRRKCGRNVCNLGRCRCAWCHWRTQGYSPDPSIVFNGRRPFSSDDCDLAVNLPPWISSGVARKPSNPNKARLAVITSGQRFRVPERDEKPAYRRIDNISVRYPTKEGRMRMKIGIVGVTCHADGEEKGRLDLLIVGSGEGMEMSFRGHRGAITVHALRATNMHCDSTTGGDKHLSIRRDSIQRRKLPVAKADAAPAEH